MHYQFVLDLQLRCLFVCCASFVRCMNYPELHWWFNCNLKILCWYCVGLSENWKSGYQVCSDAWLRKELWWRLQVCFESSKSAELHSRLKYNTWFEQKYTANEKMWVLKSDLNSSFLDTQVSLAPTHVRCLSVRPSYFRISILSGSLGCSTWKIEESGPQLFVNFGDS